MHDLVARIYEDTGHSEWAAIEREKQTPAAAACSPPSLECEFAAGHFHEIAATKADSPNSMYWLGRVFLALAREAFQRLQKLPPSRESYEATAVTEEIRGEYPEVAVAWRQAVQMEPSDVRLQRRLALALCHSNDCIALPLLKEQLAHDPTSAELNYLYGLALNSTKNPDQAIPYLEVAVRQDGKFFWPSRSWRSLSPSRKGGTSDSIS